MAKQRKVRRTTCGALLMVISLALAGCGSGSTHIKPPPIPTGTPELPGVYRPWSPYSSQSALASPQVDRLR